MGNGQDRAGPILAVDYHSGRGKTPGQKHVHGHWPSGDDHQTDYPGTVILGRLAPGQIRPLTSKEIQGLKDKFPGGVPFFHTQKINSFPWPGGTPALKTEPLK